MSCKMGKCSHNKFPCAMGNEKATKLRLFRNTEKMKPLMLTHTANIKFNPPAS